MYLICHNCHALEGNVFTNDICTNYSFDGENIITNKCKKCSSVYEFISKGSIKLLALLSNDVNYCNKCNTYIFIDKGNLFDCNKCNDFHKHCISQFVMLIDKDYQSMCIEDYLTFGTDEFNCECLNYHDTQKIDNYLADLNSDSERLDYLFKVLNMHSSI